MIKALIILSVFFCNSSHAYIGPGIGGGVFAVLVGILLAIILFIFSIFYYPIKKLIKRLKNKKK